MSQTNSRFFDEFAKLMTNAAGAAQGVRHEVDTLFKTRAERMLRELDVVSREEFDAVREMAAKARMQNDALEKRIAGLETALAKITPRAKAPARETKAPAKKATAPARGEKAPARETKAPARGVKAPAKKAKAPARKKTKPGAAAKK